ncbi:MULTISPECIES: SDR family NAD(P)-dependent oxidoreductase [unclassified Rhodococcus (in: high G+C Gram-positive bacteria)]|uniref:SDR family NAD(P)-dependent oxidoreductase n=1 Tax=unclassified Rhodococcus (in: high G+C Gram-positive bacteria) TaxID=192944 RepID=UPI000A90CB4A|nr:MULTISPECIES: SDR family NAD(P)-dependent oxidoreductase [unclassified Rhodococcus (in: high G+C Gram-positive bacteria)]
MPSSSSLTGRTIVVTGASDGIGKIAARTLAGRGADVLIVGRSPEKTAAAASEIGGRSFVADFASFDDVRRVAEEISNSVDHIDVLLNNAGGTFDPKNRTAEGHEPNVQINHLSPFLLTHLLLDRLGGSAGSRIVNTSSVGNLGGRIDLQDIAFDASSPAEFRAYCTSKLMNIGFTYGATARWADRNITSVAVHPGAVRSNFGHDNVLFRLIYRTPLKYAMSISAESGAEPLVALAADRSDAEISGIYYSRNSARGRVNGQIDKPGIVDGLWTESEKLVGLA